MPEETLAVDFTVDDAALLRLRNKWGTGAGNAGAFLSPNSVENITYLSSELDVIAHRLEQALKDQFSSHNQSGYTVSTFHVEGHGLDLHIVMSGAAVYIEYGTAPHIIEARNGGALYWDDADHPVKEVNHPGYAGDDFVGRAMDEVDVKTWLHQLAYGITGRMRGSAESAITGDVYDMGAPGVRMGGLLE